MIAVLLAQIIIQILKFGQSRYPFMRSYMKICDPRQEFCNFRARHWTFKTAFVEKPIPLTPGKGHLLCSCSIFLRATFCGNASSFLRPCPFFGSKKRSTEAEPEPELGPKTKRICIMTEVVTSLEVSLPPREDSHCKMAQGWKASSAEEHPILSAKSTLLPVLQRKC